MAAVQVHGFAVLRHAKKLCYSLAPSQFGQF